jgi:MerR family transcriptional regulator/heat shock protein HspR
MDSPIFVISVAAELAGLHAQTLRSYDRLGLVSPGRAAGGGRRYSPRDIALLREVQRLSQDEGVNLAGIKRIIELEQVVDELRGHLEELERELAAARAAAEQAAAAVHASYRRDLVPVDRRQALVVWRPKPRK